MGKTGNFRHLGSRFFVGNSVFGKDTPLSFSDAAVATSSLKSQTVTGQVDKS